MPPEGHGSSFAFDGPPGAQGNREDRRETESDAAHGVMAELVATNDLTDPSQHGWALDYLIRRDDGEELHAEVRCWDRAREAARQAGNASALDAIADRGVAAALESAELVDSPVTRGAVMISIWFDAVDNGNLRQTVSYER